ncbi:hypothetical protein DMN91_012359 [Ooceraea biroi]|uniref:CCHC-type domain-containing protein n=1 Tax=Ooceraea biroi TaxID=2015173 RepID=A0A3L8D4I1_OOCBI|nr:hypothetical protein DMN91_012359 [Ooceraea biroi]
MPKSWIYNSAKTEWQAKLQRLGLDDAGTIDELRRRMSEYVTAPPKHTPRPNPPSRPEMNPPTGTAGARDTTTVPDVTTGPPGESVAKTINQIRKWGCHFDGKDPVAFLERATELKKSYGYGDSQMLAGLPELFRGEALLWCRNCRDEWQDWGDFMQAFRDHFLPSRYRAQLLREIKDRYQKLDEPFHKFANELCTLMRRAGTLIPTEQLDQLYENMNPQYRYHISRGSLQKISELSAHASELDASDAECRARRPAPKPPVTASTAYGRTECCWRCKQRGHTRRDCQRPMRHADARQPILPPPLTPTTPTRTGTVGTITGPEGSHLQTFLADELPKFSTVQGPTDRIQHEIRVTTSVPIKQRYRPRNPAMQAVIDRAVEQMLRDGVIEPSNSAWSPPVVLVKKRDGSHRFCIDYRRVNDITERDAYPLPQITATLDKLRGAKYFSTLDLKSGYWQVPLTAKSRPVTAFTVPGKGLMQFRVMPFGLHSAPATFQRLLDQVLGPELEPEAFVYLDDIVICTRTFHRHLVVLREVFCRLREIKLRLNNDKCWFCISRIKYLGHIVDRDGIRTDSEKRLESPTGRLGRWAFELRQHDFEVKYRKGALNSVADALSRQPVAAGISRVRCAWYQRLWKAVRRNSAEVPDYRIRAGSYTATCFTNSTSTKFPRTTSGRSAYPATTGLGS